MSIIKVRDIKIAKDFTFEIQSIVDLKNERILLLGQDAKFLNLVVFQLENQSYKKQFEQEIEIEQKSIFLVEESLILVLTDKNALELWKIEQDKVVQFSLNIKDAEFLDELSQGNFKFFSLPEIGLIIFQTVGTIIWGIRYKQKEQLQLKQLEEVLCIQKLSDNLEGLLIVQGLKKQQVDLKLNYIQSCQFMVGKVFLENENQLFFQIYDSMKNEIQQFNLSMKNFTKFLYIENSMVAIFPGVFWFLFKQEEQLFQIVYDSKLNQCDIKSLQLLNHNILKNNFQIQNTYYERKLKKIFIQFQQNDNNFQQQLYNIYLFDIQNSSAKHLLLILDQFLPFISDNIGKILQNRFFFKEKQDDEKIVNFYHLKIYNLAISYHDVKLNILKEFNKQQIPKIYNPYMQQEIFKIMTQGLQNLPFIV